MGGGHGHGPPYVIPDYKVYKVESVPKLVELRRALAQDGLKDPWIRNEVWKYQPESTYTTVTKYMLRGCARGLVLAVFTSALTYYWEYKESQEHGKKH